MAPFLPITLSGDNLGQRHRYLNSLVREAYDKGASLQDIETLPEKTPVDRLFKIDLATKLKNVDYIIRNLKDNNMLYVSRALKSTWLLEHRDIINPKYLEDVLFPEMVMPAVSKMKHWLYINLRDPLMCQEFYQYYKQNKFEFAIKFLSHCNNEFILNEIPTILAKISTHYLKVLSEKCPKVAKIYFDSLATDEALRTRYLRQEQSYYNSVKCVLKADADVFLDITEKYFNVNSFNRFSPSATDFILSCHKKRYMKKFELYVAYFLHIPTLAARLSTEECQEVVVKLARANYLQNWFQYKVVEPLVKRLSPDKRAAFKKRVFVEKDVGECVNEWPYEIPDLPTHSDPGQSVFDDRDFVFVCGMPRNRSMMGGREMVACSYKLCSMYQEDCEIRMKTDLDRLFDEFRFIGFDRALHDLAQRLGAAGSADRRRDMFLVLVSKSGGRSDAVSALLRLAVRHSNEPAHTRAAVLRSLVKRANVWRVSADVWQHLLDFGHGLGLDGASSEILCREGLHAVVIRQLMAGECAPAVHTAFLNNFSTLAEYSLTVDERARVVLGLQNMLAAASLDAKPAVAAERLGQLLDVLQKYRVRVEATSPTVKAVVALALRDKEVARPLLERLYNEKIARRELLRVNLEFRRDGAALVNALRHDPPALNPGRVVELFAAGEDNFDRFVFKLVVYFNEKEGFATKLRAALKEKITKKPNVKLARPLASLIGNDLEIELHELDAADTERARLAAALKACTHHAGINAAEWGWRKAGVKAVATRVMCCPENERAGLIRALATERRTIRVALSLSMRSECELLVDTFASASMLRPAAALRAALLYFRRFGAKSDPRVWEIVKPLMSSVDLSSREYLRRLLKKTDWIPSTIKPDYCATLYLAFDKIANSSAEHVLRDLSNLLPEVSDESFENILLRMLVKTDDDMPALPCPAIFIRYLMLSRNDEDLKRRFEKIGNRFLERMDTLRCENDSNFRERLDQMMESLKYNAVFFDNKFTSCLSVIVRIIAWMQDFMPKEKYFKKYAQIHLTMLYFKGVRQSISQTPKVFKDPKLKMTDGVLAVGYSFGKFISLELAELVDKYFDSVVELYTGALVDYLGEYFMYGSSRAKFIGAVVKGILDEGAGSHRRMAVYVFRERRYDMEESARKEIEELMMKVKPIEFFVHAELFT